MGYLGEEKFEKPNLKILLVVVWSNFIRMIFGKNVGEIFCILKMFILECRGVSSMWRGTQVAEGAGLLNL